MNKILTWRERAMKHPDHQSGMISEDMIRARMGEEIADLRAEVERLREVLTIAVERQVLLRRLASDARSRAGLARPDKDLRSPQR